MAWREHPCAASSLLTALFDGEPVPLAEVARTRVSVYYDTGRSDVPILGLCTHDAVRLPHAVVTGELPGPGDATVGRSGLEVGEARWVARRWWLPPRPRSLPVPAGDLMPLWPDSAALLSTGVTSPRPTYDGLQAHALVGAGPGLTPAGDDVLAGALVTAAATGDPRLPLWRRATRRELAIRGTTAVSRSMLAAALDGYATPELAGLLTAVCTGRDATEARARLLGVGHSSGSALLVGVLHTLTTTHLRGAA